jgi:ankyrin repeat protein
MQMSMSATTRESPTAYAAASGHLEAARLLLERNAEVNARNHLVFTLPCASTNGTRRRFAVIARPQCR